MKVSTHVLHIIYRRHGFDYIVPNREDRNDSLAPPMFSKRRYGFSLTAMFQLDWADTVPGPLVFYETRCHILHPLPRNNVFARILGLTESSVRRRQVCFASIILHTPSKSPLWPPAMLCVVAPAPSLVARSVFLLSRPPSLLSTLRGRRGANQHKVDVVHFRGSRRAGVGVVVPAFVHPPILRDQARPLATINDFVRYREWDYLYLSLGAVYSNVCCSEDF